MSPCYRFTGPGLAALLLPALLAAAPFPPAPAPAAAERELTLADAVAYSLEHNGDLRALREERAIPEAGLLRAGLFPNPVLEGEYADDVLFADESEMNASVALSQEFPIAGKRRKRLSVARKGLEIHDGRIADAERLLAEEVKRAFFDVLLAQDRSSLAERSIGLNEVLLRVALERFDAGDIPELEVNLVRVELARAEERQLEAGRDLEEAKRKLFARMGLPPGEEARLAAPPEAAPLAAPVESLRSSALARRPDLLALASEAERAEAEIGLAEAEGKPDITAGIAWQRERSAFQAGPFEGKDTDDLLGVRVSVPLPLFDRNQAGIREARSRRAAAQTRYRFARIGIEREVEVAWARLTAAERAVELYRTRVFPQLEENLDLTREAYRLGEVGILSVLEEQRKYVEVHERYFAALHGRNAARARLESAYGGAPE